MILNEIIRLIYKNYPFTRGKHRLNGLFKYTSGFEISKDFRGNKFLLNLDNYIDSIVYLDGGYEKQNIEVLKKACIDFKSNYFIDIGANIGIYTVNFAKELFIEKCYSFEPDQQNYTQLSANIFLNGLSSKVETFNYALSDTNKEGELFLFNKSKNVDFGKHNAGAYTLEKDSDKDRHRDSIQVKIIYGDKLLNIVKQKICIKIDIEGHELPALQGLEKTLKSNQIILLIEIFDEQYEKTVDYLKGIGFIMDNSVELTGENYFFKNYGLNEKK